MPSISKAEASNAQVDEALPRGLSALSFGVCLTLTLVIFACLHPLWEPMSMDQVDQSILWSYYPIPLFVLAALALERKLRWASWFLETLRLTLVKFAITFLFANTMWIFFAEPPGVQPGDEAPISSVPASAGSYEVVAAPAAVLPDPDSVGSLAGVVVDREGRVVSSAVVYVSEGLQHFRWPVEQSAARLAVNSDGFDPPLLLVQTFQPLELSALDDQMHTARATDANGRMLFNYPVLPGTERTVMFHHGQGLVTLSCLAHDHDGPAHLFVLAHPFARVTGTDGAFEFTGLPEGELELSAWRPDSSARPRSVSIERGQQARLELVLD